MQRQRNMLPGRFRRHTRFGRQQPAVDRGLKEPTWPGTVMALGVILWLVAFWFLGSFTLISYIEMFRWFALFAFMGNLIPYRISGRKLHMERGEWFFFNLLAIGPLFFTLGLGINMLFHGPEKLYVVPQAARMDVHQYWVLNDELPAMRPYDPEAIPQVHPGDHMLGLASGAFGYDVITTWARIVPEAASPSH